MSDIAKLAFLTIGVPHRGGGHFGDDPCRPEVVALMFRASGRWLGLNEAGAIDDE